MTLDNYIFAKFKKYSKIRYWENRINILRNVDVTAKKYVVYVKNAKWLWARRLIKWF